jgi:hypothetical protein
MNANNHYQGAFSSEKNQHEGHKTGHLPLAVKNENELNFSSTLSSWRGVKTQE